MNETPASLGPPQRFWIASIWLGLGLFDATETVIVMHAEGMHHAWFHLFIMLLVTPLPWAFATPIVLRLGRQYPLLSLKSFNAWLRHAVAWASIGLLSAAWMAFLAKILNPLTPLSAPPPFIHGWLERFYNQLISSIILYICIIVVGYMLNYRDQFARQQTESARLSEQLSQAQLSALRQQFEPHFIFNTLNAITGLVRERRNDAAVSMIAGLSDLLRRVLDNSDRQQVPLKEELEFLKKYLDIQKARFAERFHFSIDIPHDLFLASVPTFILQPIVENAVKHGIAKRAEGGMIQITASRSDRTLILSVYNDGPNLSESWDKNQPGIGLTNVRTRLQSLYGRAFELTMRNQGKNGVEVAVCLPLTEG